MCWQMAPACENMHGVLEWPQVTCNLCIVLILEVKITVVLNQVQVRNVAPAAAKRYRYKKIDDMSRSMIKPGQNTTILTPIFF